MVLSQVKLNRVTGWYAGLVRQVFLPNADLFGYLVAFGAARRGSARLGAAMGLVMSFAYLFAGTSGDNLLMVLRSANHHENRSRGCLESPYLAKRTVMRRLMAR